MPLELLALILLLQPRVGRDGEISLYQAEREGFSNECSASRYAKLGCQCQEALVDCVWRNARSRAASFEV